MNTNKYRYWNEEFKELLIPAKFDCERLGVKEFLNGFFLGLNEWIKLWNFNGIISLFMFTEAEQVGFVLWPMLVKKQFILFIDDLSKFFCLKSIGGFRQMDAFFPIHGGSFGNDLTA